MVASFPGSEVQEGRLEEVGLHSPSTLPHPHTPPHPSNGRLDSQSHSRLIRAAFKGQNPHETFGKTANNRKETILINKKEKSEKYFKVPGRPS